MLDDKMKKDNFTSNDIRSMEVRTDYSNISNAKLVRVDYYGNDGQDIFLSHKSCQCKICFNYIFSFLNRICVSLLRYTQN